MFQGPRHLLHPLHHHLLLESHPLHPLRLGPGLHPHPLPLVPPAGEEEEEEEEGEGETEVLYSAPSLAFPPTSWRKCRPMTAVGQRCEDNHKIYVCVCVCVCVCVRVCVCVCV